MKSAKSQLKKLVSLYHLCRSIRNDYRKIMPNETKYLASRITDIRYVIADIEQNYMEDDIFDDFDIKELVYDTVSHIERKMLPDMFRIVWEQIEKTPYKHLYENRGEYIVICDIDNCLPA